MSTDNWSVDKRAGIVKHVSGLTLEFEHGELVNIEAVPGSIKTHELPRLIDDGLMAYKNHKSEPVPATQSYMPKRTVLALKKKA